MAKQVEHEVAYYYDFHPTEEDLMEERRILCLRSQRAPNWQRSFSKAL